MDGQEMQEVVQVVLEKIAHPTKIADMCAEPVFIIFEKLQTIANVSARDGHLHVF